MILKCVCGKQLDTKWLYRDCISHLRVCDMAKAGRRMAAKLEGLTWPGWTRGEVEEFTGYTWGELDK